MYSTCLFCSAKPGRNEATEAFPVGGAALAAALPLIATAGVPFALLNVVQVAAAMRIEAQKRRIVHRVRAPEPGAKDMIIRRWHLHHAVLGRTDIGELSIDLPPLIMQSEWKRRARSAGAGRNPTVRCESWVSPRGTWCPVP